MLKDRELNIALFIDFDNVALGARDAGRKFDIQLLLQKVLDRGKVIIKRAYADWHFYKEYIDGLHQAAIELIEVPSPRISGKNSADIRLVVDAMDLCFSKNHIDTFVIVSGDSDFSPLVSKLRENDKRVLGIGMRNSSSKLLIGNCDEFIFFDDLIRPAGGRLGGAVSSVPQDKRALFEFLLETVRGLLQERSGNLYSSLIKDTMKRKRPDFNEGEYGYSTFGDLLEDARVHNLLEVIRDNQAGGTWVVVGLGKEATVAPANQPRRRSRGGRGRGGKRRQAPGERQVVANGAAAPESPPAEPAKESAGQEGVGTDSTEKTDARKSSRRKPDSRRSRGRKTEERVAEDRKEEKATPSADKSAKKPLFIPGPVEDTKSVGAAAAPRDKSSTPKGSGPAKTSKAPEKKPARKPARKPAKKVAAKSTGEAAGKKKKKVTKKVTKKPTKKVTKKTARKPEKKTVKKIAKKTTAKTTKKKKD